MTPPGDAAVMGAGAAAPSARRTTRAAMWATLDTISQVLVSTLGFLIVARVLGPSDFGVAALSFGIFQIINLFVEPLLQDAVVQRANLTRVQISSAFWWNLASGALMMVLLFLTAPLFARLLDAPPIANLLRVMSVGLIFTGAGAVPIALLRRSLSFRSLTACSIVTRLITAFSSAGLAIAGAGAFSLVAQTTIGPLLLTTLVITVSRWRPSFEFSWTGLKALLLFGMHVIGNQFVWVGSMRLYIVCIGLLFSPTAVGFYNIAQRVVDTARETISTAVASLSLPVLSRYQHDHAQFRHLVSQGTALLCLIVLPIFAIIGGCATPLVRLLLTDKWLAAVPIIQLFAGSTMLHFFRYMQVPAMSAAGRPDLGLLLSVLSTIVVFTFLFVFGRHSFFLASAGWAFLRLAVLFPMGAVALRRTIGLSLRSQAFNGLGAAFAAVMAGVVAYLVSSVTSLHVGISMFGDAAAIVAGGLIGLLVHLAVVAAVSRDTLVMAVRILTDALKRST